MIVEPYDFKFPFSIECLETDPMRESNYVSKSEDRRENQQSAFAFNRTGDTRGARSRLMDFSCSYFTPGILTINVEALTCCERALADDAACLTNPSFGPWKNEMGYRSPKRPSE